MFGLRKRRMNRKKGEFPVRRSAWKSVVEKPKSPGEYVVCVRWDGMSWYDPDEHLILRYDVVHREWNTFGDKELTIKAWAPLPK